MPLSDPELNRQYHREYYRRVRKSSSLSYAEKSKQNVEHLDELPETPDGQRFLYYWEVPGYTEYMT